MSDTPKIPDWDELDDEMENIAKKLGFTSAQQMGRMVNDRFVNTCQDIEELRSFTQAIRKVAAHSRNELHNAQAKLKEAEERRREDIRKCWRLSLGHHVEAHPIFVSGADSIKTAFPDVFDEKERHE